MNKRDFLRCGLIGGCGLLIADKLFALNNNLFVPVNLAEKPWKWSKEGYFYVVTPKGTKCLICPNECTLKEGEDGDCRNRVNKNGKLYSIAYGNPCSVNVYPIET